MPCDYQPTQAEIDAAQRSNLEKRDQEKAALDLATRVACEATSLLSVLGYLGGCSDELNEWFTDHQWRDSNKEKLERLRDHQQLSRELLQMELERFGYS